MKFSYFTLVNVILAAVLLTAILFVGATTTQSQYFTTGAGSYDPWCDLDDDGDVDIFDIVTMAGIYGSEGEPFTAKAALEYDSGWINITDKAGRYFNIIHNLNTTDIIVDIQGKTTIDGGVHQKHLGLTGYIKGWSKIYGGMLDERAESLVKTGDGGYIAAGWTLSFGAGDYDFWLVKTDAAGNVQWNRTYGGTSRRIRNRWRD